ncbi:MAG: hypothetical protein ACLT4C_06475, partial [Butyricicoccus sp.]
YHTGRADNAYFVLLHVYQILPKGILTKKLCDENIQKEHSEVTLDDSARAIFRKVPQTNRAELPQKKNTG